MTRRRNPYSQCISKRAYEYRSDAVEHAREIAAKTGVRYEAYICPHCRKYHVGSLRPVNLYRKRP